MRKFMIIVDMQNDFITGVLGSKAAIAAEKRIADYIKTLNKDDTIIFTQDTHRVDTYDNTYEGKHLPVPHCLLGSEGHEISSILMNEAINAIGRDHVYILRKGTFGTLDLGTGQYALLNTLNIKMTDKIIICGVCTDICVISNAIILHTQYPETKITCYADMCGGSSVEAHEAALKVMESCQIEVIR